VPKEVSVMEVADSWEVRLKVIVTQVRRTAPTFEDIMVYFEVMSWKVLGRGERGRWRRSLADS